MTLTEILNLAEAKEREKALREWNECLTDVVLGVTRAHQAAGTRQPTRVVYRAYGLWEIRCGRRDFGLVGGSTHLESVMAHCSESGWRVEREAPSWWDRLTGRPAGWRIEVMP